MNVEYTQHTSTSVARTQYHGLFNQGATCYLNSVLQVLFMTEDFREAVKREAADAFINHHLADLFKDLQKETANTCKIIKTLGIDRVYEQRDAAEYFEMILRLTSPEASQIFHGQSAHKTTCSQCERETDRDEPFWHLPLALVDSCSGNYSVEDGIKEFFMASNLSGENQMYCDKCDAKVDGTIKNIIKHHPEVLILLLKRFEFSYYYMSYVKINCAVDVPYILHVPESQTYELYAVVEHFGDLRRGHYVAKIKCQNVNEDRWYAFDDSRVTLIPYQQLQVNNTEKFQSAYLLFYRKMKNDGIQDIREVSSNAGFQPATSNSYDQRQDAEMTRKREEGEETVEVGNDTAVAGSIGSEEEETVIGEIINVGSRGEEMLPDLCCKVDNDVYLRQGGPNRHQEHNEEIKDACDSLQNAHVRKQERDEGKTLLDNEDMRGNADSEDRVENRAPLPVENTLRESVEDDENAGLADARQRRPGTNCDFEPEVSDMLAVHSHLSKQSEISNTQRPLRDVKTGDEPSQKKRTKCFDGHTEHRGDKGLDNVRQNINEYQEGEENGGKDSDFKPVGVEKEADQETLEIDDATRKTGDDRLSERKKLLRICDLYLPNYGINSDEKQNIPKDDPRRKRGSSRRREEEEVEERDVKGGKDYDVRQNRQKISVTQTTHEDVGVKRQIGDVKEDELKRGDDKHAQRTKASVMKPYLREGGDDQCIRRSEDVRSNREQKTGPTRTTHKDFSVEKQIKEQENEGDSEKIQRSEKSFLRTAESERRKELQENQGDADKISIIITEEGITETPTHSKRSEPKYIRIKSIDETHSQIRNATRKSALTNDAKATLSTGAVSLKLDESPLPKQQKHRSRRVSGKTQEENETFDPNAIQKLNISEAQVNDAKTKRGAHKDKQSFYSPRVKPYGKEKGTRKKSTGCMPFFCKCGKNADQALESD